jgi:hypothetical protein
MYYMCKNGEEGAADKIREFNSFIATAFESKTQQYSERVRS